MDDIDGIDNLIQLRKLVDKFPVPAPPSKGALAKVVIRKDPPRKNASIKQTSIPLHGGDWTTYLAWRRAILSALRIDWNTFKYSSFRVFSRVYKVIEGKAKE